MTDPELPADDANQLSRHTTPTWEVEMLISGAAVFAMLQAPSWLQAHLLPLIPRFTDNISDMLVVLYAYLVTAVIILAITFSLHLILRARWIALVGMHSVFPDGVRWDKLSLGQVQREVAQQADRGAADSIERADNRATVVFALGTMLAITMLTLSVAVVISLGVAVVIHLATGYAINAVNVLFALVVLLFAPLILVAIVDKSWSRRRPGNPRARRLLAPVLKFYARIGAVQGYTVGRLLESHFGPRRFHVLTVAVLFPIIAGVALSMLTWSNPLGFGSYGLFPHPATRSARAVVPAHYDDQRDPSRDAASAFIQSDVVTGPYVALTIPYLPGRDAAALRDHCPAVHAAHSAQARINARFDCLTALHQVFLDGKPLTALHYDTTGDPRTHRPALLAMIDVRDLAAGRHVLRVTRAPVPPGSHPRDNGKDWLIPFWR
ncbi:MAG TPA: hypothetical protein VF269_07480 [Rhodanobacteraceae bacterium]